MAYWVFVFSLLGYRTRNAWLLIALLQRPSNYRSTMSSQSLNLFLVARSRREGILVEIDLFQAMHLAVVVGHGVRT